MADHQNNIPRLIDLPALLARKSFFLLGPRQTGKTWLIRHTLKNCRVYNLLDSDTFLTLSRSPKRIAEELRPSDKVIVIDEIQRLPDLLNEVQLLIEEKHIRFLLTGSSARKIRRGGVNLLGGRARTRNLHPFVFKELGRQFDLLRALNHGLLPPVYFSDEPDEDLRAYTGDYLKEEIAAEGVTRNIPAFSRFLQVAALCNAKIINYTNIANDAQVARTTVQEYFHILRDTFIGYDLPAWKHSRKRKPISTAKFYFFDTGVVRCLQNRSAFRQQSPEFGEFFESFCFHELKTYVDYHQQEDLYYWRSTAGHEVDFIISNHTAIEVKAKKNVNEQDLKGILVLKEEQKLKNYVCVSLDDRPRTVNGITILPWNSFLEKLWAGDFGD